MQDIWQKNNIKWSPKIHNFLSFVFTVFQKSIFTQTTTKTFFVVKKLCLGVIKYVNWPQEFFCVRKFLVILVNNFEYCYSHLFTSDIWVVVLSKVWNILYRACVPVTSGTLVRKLWQYSTEYTAECCRCAV